jgi:hypothetical protein
MPSLSNQILRALAAADAAAAAVATASAVIGSGQPPNRAAVAPLARRRRTSGATCRKLTTRCAGMKSTYRYPGSA